MGRTLSEATVTKSVVETSLGTAAATGWRQHQPNSIGKLSAQFKFERRDPIGAGRMQQKGDLVGLAAGFEMTSDVNKETVDAFVEGMMMALSKGSGGTGVAQFAIASTTATDYVVAASGNLAANFLVYARGLAVAADNGLKVLGAGSTGTAIKPVGGLTAAAAPASNALVEVAGFRASINGSIQLDASGDIISATDDLSVLGLFVGQWIWVGGTIGGSNAFATAGYRGFAQVKSIAAGKIGLRRRQWTVGAADLAAAKKIDLYFGRWTRNTTAQDADYIERSYTVETTYQTLGGPTTPEFGYNFGQYLAQTVFNLNPGTRATMEMTFLGTGTIDPSTTRLTGASSSPAPLSTALLNCATGMTRLRMTNADETGLTTDIKSLKLTIGNMVTGEDMLANLGPKYINVGDFSATIEGVFLFTSHDMIVGVRDGRTCMLEVGIRNGDGGLLIDLPSCQLETAEPDISPNESVKIKSTISGNQDLTYGFVAGISHFPYLPSA
jgi:hypothetical protein